MTRTDRELAAMEAARRLVEVGHPTKVILFGSAARGDADDESDLDFWWC